MPDSNAASAIWRFAWRWLPGRTAAQDRDLLERCVRLFSTDYGRWGPGGPRPGRPVQISVDHLYKLLDSEDAYIVCAEDGATVAGYAVILRFSGTDGRRIAWIAQLVVGSSYRRSGVATTLLFSAWQFSDIDVWGLVTASPYAIRALETATRRPCSSTRILNEGRGVLHDLRQYLDYLPEDFDKTDSRARPTVDTKFNLDLSELKAMRRKVAKADRPWNLGLIDEGHEWFAATFSSQSPSVARGEYLDRLLKSVDHIWIRAYEGMTLDADHVWHRYADSEVDWILAQVPSPRPLRVLDAGCGDGRHSIALARRGHDVTGIEISPRLSEKAQRGARDAGVAVDFQVMDLRKATGLAEQTFELIVCLYDVVGSSADPGADRQILARLRRLVAPNGHLVLSVMSAESTLPNLPTEHRPPNEEAFVAILEAMPPSRNMEMSGNIFDAGSIVYFNGSYYRKEQFDVATNLPPAELIVRDRRFAASEVLTLLGEAGFRDTVIVGMRAGRWDEPLEADSPQAREIIVIAMPG